MQVCDKIPLKEYDFSHRCANDYYKYEPVVTLSINLRDEFTLLMSISLVRTPLPLDKIQTALPLGLLSSLLNAYLFNTLPPKTSDARSDTITRSFRFDEELSGVLEEEAERMGISVNSVVSIILRRFAEFTRFLSKIDMVIINRELLTTLIDSIDENTLSTLGSKLGYSVPKDTIVFWKKRIDEENVFEYIEKIICRYGHLGTYDEVNQPTARTIVIRHRLGKKGSKFFESFFRSMLMATIGKEPTFELTDASIKIEIRH